MRFVLLVFLLTIALPAAAQNTGVLLPTVPHPENKAAIVNAIKQGFLGREWTVVAADDTSVTAILKHNQIDARMRVWVEGGQLRYEETSTRRQPGSHAPSATSITTVGPVKLGNWLENLRIDIGRLVALVPAAPAASSRDIAARLKTLDELHAQGVITQDEYTKKRAEILSGL